ncbi:MAG TPA: threonine synthase [Acidobacteriota bacterium]|nr:threonine synthase [Acidobacteriota bacterium]
MNSYLTGLECSRCAASYTADVLRNLCSCGAPLLARYDLNKVARVVSREDFGYRVHSLWRFKELLPVQKPENIVSLYEGFTPLIPSCHAAGRLGLRSLCFKDEGLNPTGSFKSRGLSVAISRALELGATEIALPTAGNAGGAAAAYAARAGLKCHVFMPKDTPRAFETECRALGADVRKVDGVITDAGKAMQAELKQKGWFDVSTCKEPYRVEGKKTILYEIAQQLNWSLPDVLVYPTGGGTGIVAAWKALYELKELGWISRFKMPRLVAVQAAGCAPMVRAYENGDETATEWEHPETTAWGLRVPRAVADFLILRAVRDSQGTAIAVTDDETGAALADFGREGMFVAPEAAAGLAGIQKLVEKGLVGEEETVILVVTGNGLKYSA